MGGALTLVRHYLSARRSFQQLCGEALREVQDQRARAVIEYARQRSPFYRERFAGLDSSNWREFPTVDKAAMMARFDEFNTEGVGREEALAVALRAEAERDFRPTLRGLTVGLSSETSGHRGLFLVAPWEQAAWAGVVLARLLPPLRLCGYRVAFFLRSNSNLYTRLRNRWIDFRYFDLMLPLPEAVAALNDLQPDLIAGPPSLLRFLAEAAGRGELRTRPERVISFAEVLEPQDRERIGRSFGVVVHEVYQCTEGLLAMSCPHGSLHVQEDLVAFQTEAVPGGEDERRVTPIVTDLWRRSQPIIRYRMHDVVTLNPRPCACGSGFRVLASIGGRSDDVCYFEDIGGKLRPVFPDTIRRMILLASPLVLDYQALQWEDGCLTVRLQVEAGGSFESVAREVRLSVDRVLAQHGSCARSVTVEAGLQPLPARAKRRRVQRGRANEGEE